MANQEYRKSNVGNTWSFDLTLRSEFISSLFGEEFPFFIAAVPRVRFGFALRGCPKFGCSMSESHTLLVIVRHEFGFGDQALTGCRIEASCRMLFPPARLSFYSIAGRTCVPRLMVLVL